jgi:ABC-2 type transport system ATP-binding protein
MEIPGVGESHALQLELAEGEHVCLLGDEFGGACEILGTVAGKSRPLSGGIEVLGYSPQEAARKVGFASGVRDDIRIGGSVRSAIHRAAGTDGATRARRAARLTEMLHWFGLEPVADRPARELRGWSAVALRLATALAAHPPVLLLDHPMELASPAALSATSEYLSARRSDDGLAVLEATGSASVAERAVRVALLHRGRLLALDTPSRLKSLVTAEWVEAEITDPPDAERALGGLFLIEVSADGRSIRFQAEAAPEVAAHFFRHGIGGVRSVTVHRNDLWSVLRRLADDEVKAPD